VHGCSSIVVYWRSEVLIIHAAILPRGRARRNMRDGRRDGAQKETPTRQRDCCNAGAQDDHDSGKNTTSTPD
jgi:hypothetical protein